MSTHTVTKGTYQMLWDCERCDSVGLLGVDHRYCPNCGAPQDAEARYFPDRSKRVVTAYRGNTPDWSCERCGSPNASPFCVSCGAPRGASAEVATQAPRPLDAEGRPVSQTDDTAPAGPEEARRHRREQKRRRKQEARERARSGGPKTWRQRAGWLWAKLRRPSRELVIGMIASGAVLVTVVVLILTRTRGITMEVSSRTWSQTTALEEWRAVAESEWCSSMPAGAYGVTSTTRLHHHDQVPDGEVCHTEPGGCTQSCSEVDNGNGSFSEVCSQECTADRQVCTTRYRQVPVYADYCSYTIDRWVELRRQTYEGTLPEAPSWPALATPGCNTSAPSFGCQRDVHVAAQYDVLLRGLSVGAKGIETTCTVEQPTWLALTEGSQWPLRQRIVTGWIDCRTLQVPVTTPSS